MGDVEFSRLVVAHSDFLKPFAISLTRDQDTAKDLLQETLYRALANKSKYSVGSNIRAWLFTILRNTFINEFRRTARRRQVVQDVLVENLPDKSRSPFTADGHLHMKEVWNAVRELPHIFRNPFILYFEGYKYQEIAVMLDEPVGTIKSRMHFARKLLKEQLQ
jgi:RNA polymerase sigma factor (sigma-70 family)